MAACHARVYRSKKYGFEPCKAEGMTFLNFKYWCRHHDGSKDRAKMAKLLALQNAKTEGR